HSVLVFNVLGRSALDRFSVPQRDLDLAADAPQPVRDLAEAFTAVSPRRLVECYHDAVTARAEVLQMFKRGLLPLEYRALAARLYWSPGPRVREPPGRRGGVPADPPDPQGAV